MEKVMGALMIMCGEMREPVLHGAGIPQPAALNIYATQQPRLAATVSSKMVCG